MINRNTAYKDLPLAWLRDYAAHIIFPEGTNCWIWVGSDIDGYPCKTFRDPETGKVKRTRVVTKICEMFWKYPDNYYVEHTCGTRNCVNPNHIIPTKYHWRQR